MNEVVVVENDRVGLLADISYLLGKERINIESIDLHVVGNKAVVRLVVGDYQRAIHLLASAGFSVYGRNERILLVPNSMGSINYVSELDNWDSLPIGALSVIASDLDNAVVSVKSGVPL